MNAPYTLRSWDNGGVPPWSLRFASRPAGAALVGLKCQAVGPPALDHLNYLVAN